MVSIKFWDKLSKSYDNKVLKKYDNAYKDTVRLSKKYINEKDNVLDFGCGTGLGTIELSKYAKTIHGIDLSTGMIKNANNKIKGEKINNIKFEVKDIFSKSLVKESYDVVLAFNILHFIDDIDRTLDRINKLLKENGKFIAVTDCFREGKKVGGVKEYCLRKIGMLSYSCDELKNKIESNGFYTLEEKILFDKPVNYFIITNKIRK